MKFHGICMLFALLFILSCGSTSGSGSYSNSQTISGSIASHTLNNLYQKLARFGYPVNRNESFITSNRLNWISEWNYTLHSYVTDEDVERGIYEARSRIKITAAARDGGPSGRINRFGNIRIHVDFQVRSEDNPQFHTMELYGFHNEEWKRISSSLRSLLLSGGRY